MSDGRADLPDDVREEMEEGESKNDKLLDAIGTAIASKRDAARDARKASGIEDTWTYCEEAYAGIDDMNRAEAVASNWIKPMSMEGPITTANVQSQKSNRSTVFVRLTARYVDAGAAKLAEILLPADDKAFSFSETPVPQLIAAKEDTRQVLHEGLGNIPLERPAKPGELPPQPSNPGATGAPASLPAPAQGAVPTAGAGGGMVPLTVKDFAEEAIKLARAKAKKAEKRVHDWLIECQYAAEMRKVIFDGARLGVGVVKGPVPKPKKIMAVSNDNGKIEATIKEILAPTANWVNPWNFFPDPSCGENIHDGDFCFERARLSESQVRELKKIPGYIANQIDRVLEEGPATYGDEKSPGETKGGGAKEKRFDVWYFYGALSGEDMDCIRTAAGRPPKEKSKKPCYAIATLINKRVVRGVINPLESGAFPYHAFPWQRRSGSWAGIGVGEQVKVPQKIVNGATRAMNDNAGLSAGVQIVINRDAIVPADGSHHITPNKVWYKTGDSATDDVRKDFQTFTIDNTTDSLMKIIQYGMQLAEESSSIPLITQGQSGKTTPDTFGATQLQNNNANQLLRGIGYSFDDYITEPLIRQFYEWLLNDPAVPSDEKGDYTIHAHGSVALVERAIQDQTIAQMGPLTLNPAYGWDPKRWATLYAKSKRIDPKDLEYTDEEKQAMANTPPPKAPAVEAAEIRAGVDREKITSGQEIAKGDAALQMEEIKNRRELALLDYANRQNISLEQTKADLAKTVMTLNTQKELSGAKQVAESAAEPAGRAPDGMGFEK